MKDILWVLSMFLFLSCSSNSTTDLESEKNTELDNLEVEGGIETSSALANKPNTLSEEEKAEGWELLFDGRSFDKWTKVGSDEFPENGWVIENDAMVLGEGGNILTREQYSDFDLKFEFNLTPEANSGIKYFVAKLENKESGAVVTNGPEYQIIDDYSNPDVKEDPDETVKTAALYLFYVPENKKLLPPGEWNTGRIVAKDKHVEHWLNGVKVLSYERGSEDYRKRREETKFKNYKEYGEVPSGHIYLTDHGDKVYFRNLKIKRL